MEVRYALPLPTRMYTPNDGKVVVVSRLHHGEKIDHRKGRKSKDPIKMHW